MSVNQSTIDTQRDHSGGPDFNNPTSVTTWFRDQILDIYSTMSRGQKAKAEVRLRVLSQALDCWQRLFKLASDASELSDLRSELNELRAMIQTPGPKAVRQ